MKTQQIIIYIIIFLAMAVMVITLKEVREQSPSNIKIDDLVINLEIAKTQDQRQAGLMNRDFLCTDCGMLFIFDSPDTHTFWMKNTLIPLQIIHINKDLVVVDLIEAKPCTQDPCTNYLPKEDSLYVLEVNKGTFNPSIIGKKAVLTLI